MLVSADKPIDGVLIVISELLVLSDTVEIEADSVFRTGVDVENFREPGEIADIYEDFV